MSTTRRKLAPAFARRVCFGMIVLIVAGTLLFAGSTYRLMVSQSRHYRTQQARLCAAALIAGKNGDLSDSFSDLRDRFSGLVAVATLDAYGNVKHVYPKTPAAAAVVDAAHGARGEPVAVQSPFSPQDLFVTSSIAPMNGDPSMASQRALIVMRTRPIVDVLSRPVAWFAGILAMAALVVMGTQIRWFERHIVVPLWRLTDSIGQRRRRSRFVPPIEPGEWSETSEFASRCHALLQDLADSEARTRQIEHETVDELRRRQHGFDRMLRRARDQATLDPLTGVRNRTFLEEELEASFGRSRASDADFSAMMIDVDNFKHYNDTQGHQAGDALLRFVGALLRGSIRPTDHAVRYGGDEFLILLPATSAAEAAEIGERLLKLFVQYIACLGHGHGLSLSAGVASLENDAPQNGHDLVAMADAAMYEAKRNGKNGVECHRAA